MLRVSVSGLALLVAIAAAAFDGHLAAAQEYRPVETLLEMRHEKVIVQKFDLSCGAATLATILNYQFGDPVTERQVAAGLIQRQEYIEHPELIRIRQGFSLLDMKRYLGTRGYIGTGYGNMEFADLTKLAPIIVAVSPIGYNHFVIFRGVIGDKVLLADPAFGNRTMSIEKFERIWINFPELGRVGFTVSRDGKQAPPGLLGMDPTQFIAPAPMLVRNTVFR
jgi:predicted double-glycine peptidase